MIEVKLYTGEGKYVVTALMPEFQIWPEALIWGSRCFIRQANSDWAPEAHAPEYWEGLAVSVIKTKE